MKPVHASLRFGLTTIAPPFRVAHPLSAEGIEARVELLVVGLLLEQQPDESLTLTIPFKHALVLIEVPQRWASPPISGSLSIQAPIQEVASHSSQTTFALELGRASLRLQPSQKVQASMGGVCLLDRGPFFEELTRLLTQWIRGYGLRRLSILGPSVSHPLRGRRAPLLEARAGGLQPIEAGGEGREDLLRLSIPDIPWQDKSGPLLETAAADRALERQRLHWRVLKAREEERKRVARELHDQIAHALVGLNYQLAEMRVDLSPETACKAADLQRRVRQIMVALRRICADLRPPALDSMGLVPAIRAWLRMTRSQGLCHISLNVEGDEQQAISEEVAICIFRVLQEALRNIQKHAVAAEVAVSLRIDPAQVALVVEDDGKGFELPEDLGQLTMEGHFGLAGLRERLELLRGSLRVTSSPGRGCRLEARAPLAAPRPAPRRGSGS